MNRPDIYDVRDGAVMATILVAILVGNTPNLWNIAAVCSPFAAIAVGCHAIIRVNGGKG